MPIEFRCNQCHRLLRVPDAAAGKSAKCPECAAVVTIPDAPQPVIANEVLPAPTSGQPMTAAPPPHPSDPDSNNPYASSFVEATEVGRGPFERTDIVPTVIDVGEIMGRTWRIFLAHMGPCFLSMLCIAGTGIGIMLVLLMASGLLIVALAAGLKEMAIIPGVLLGMIAFAIYFAAMIWLQVGWILFLLKVARGQPFLYGDLFSGARYIPPVFAVSVILSVLVTLGFIALIVPGVILSLMFMPCIYFVIDRDSGIDDSFSRAKSATDGNKVTLFLLLLVQFGIGMVPFGGLLVLPYFTLMWVVAYLEMTGQPMIGQAPVPQPPRSYAPPTQA